MCQQLPRIQRHQKEMEFFRLVGKEDLLQDSESLHQKTNLKELEENMKTIHIIFDYGHGNNCPGKCSPDKLLILRMAV